MPFWGPESRFPGRNVHIFSYSGLQVEADFNLLLDRCSEFREHMGLAADALSLGRAMELLSREHGIAATLEERQARISREAD